MGHKSITIFTMRYPWGTYEGFLQEELPYILKQFDDVAIIPFRSCRTMRSVDPQVKVYLCAFRTVNLLYSFTINLPVWLKLIFKNLKFVRSVINLAQLLLRSWQAVILYSDKKIVERCNKSDVLYFYWGMGATGIMECIEHKNAVARFHSGDVYEYRRHGYIPFRYSLFSKLKILSPISTFAYSYILQKYPFTRDKLKINRLGSCDHGICGERADNCCYIVSCSTIDYIKRVDLIAEALKHIKEFNIVWLHIGASTELKQYLKLKEIVRQFPENVKFVEVGYINNDKVFDIYNKYSPHLFINVSISEGVPVSIMEAYSCGIPVLATDVGATSEIVLPEHLLSPDISPKELSEKIKAMWFDKNKDVLYPKVRSIWKEFYSAEKNYTDFSNMLKNM